MISGIEAVTLMVQKTDRCIAMVIVAICAPLIARYYSPSCKETIRTCGRFIDPNLRGTDAELSDIKINPIPRRFNVKPTNDVLILGKQPLEAMVARWWLVPSWFDGAEAKDWKATTFNARIEEAKDKPAYRAVWRRGRCMIPAGGFYEWTGPKGHRQPNVILSAGNEETLFFAGLASRWRDLLTCTILTRAANDSMAGIHDRMPVILNAEERDAWLGGSDDLDLGAGARLRHYPVRAFGIVGERPDMILPMWPAFRTAFRQNSHFGHPSVCESLID
ncbi:MAG: SOS response-associated peptidase [Luteolibacter sp.]